MRFITQKFPQKPKVNQPLANNGSLMSNLSIYLFLLNFLKYKLKGKISENPILDFGLKRFCEIKSIMALSYHFLPNMLLLLAKRGFNEKGKLRGIYP